MDKQIEIVLQYLRKETGEQYKILEIDEILNIFPKRYGITKEVLLSALNYLKENGHIIVKYYDGVEICIKATDKAEAYIEHSKHEEQRVVLKKRHYWAIFGFAVLGSIVGGIIFVLIKKLFM